MFFKQSAKFTMRHLLKCKFKITYRENHYFLVPEIPNDSSDTNVVMKSLQFPLYNQFTPKNILTGVLKQSINFEADFHSLVNTIKANNKYDSKSFDEFLKAIEFSSVPMEQGFKIARHMAYMNPYSKYMSSFLTLQNSIQMRRNLRWTNKTFYDLLKKYESNIDQLLERQQYLLKRYINYCESNGLHLAEKNFARLHELNWKIIDEQNNFKKKLNYATEKFSYVINDKSILTEIPIYVQKMISFAKNNYENGPWNITLNESVFSAFMRYCSSQQVRKYLHESYYGRASYMSESPFLNNSESIKNLINYRNEKANILGYKNFAEFSLKTKCATKAENVTSLIEAVRSKLKSSNEHEYKILQQFASKNGYYGRLNIYDIDFWRNKHFLKTYGSLTEAQTMQYFPFKRVLEGLFSLSKTLFEIEFLEKNVYSSSAWNQDVLIYEVYENGHLISILTIDPFIRPGKIDNIWSYSGRDCSKLTSSIPIAHLVLNLTDLGPSTLMNFTQVSQLFNQFGKCLQILLTMTDYSEAADLASFEFDALSITSKVFERLVHVPNILLKLSGNLKNNEPLPETLFKSLKLGSLHMKSFDVLRQCYYSAFDLECHMTDKLWTEIMEELWPKYFPIKLLKNDFHPCQFVSVFGGSFGAAFYSDLWSEMLAADIFEAFNEVGFHNDENLKMVFKRFRETFLYYGSSLPTNETFRRFRGRNPSLEPLIDSYILSNKDQ